MSINFPNADFTPQLAGYTGQGAFRFWCQKVLPIVYDDSLSYYELLNKVVVYLNNVIKDVSTVETNIGELLNAYSFLEEFVNRFKDDLEEVINNYTDYIDNYFNSLIIERGLNLTSRTISGVYVGDYLEDGNHIPSAVLKVGYDFYTAEAPTKAYGKQTHNNDGIFRKFTYVKGSEEEGIEGINEEDREWTKFGKMGHGNSMCLDTRTSKVYVAPIWSYEEYEQGDDNTKEVAVKYLHVYSFPSFNYIGTIETPEAALGVSFDSVTKELYLIGYSYKIYRYTDGEWVLVTTVDFSSVNLNSAGGTYNQDFAVHNNIFFISSPHGNILYGMITPDASVISGCYTVVNADSAMKFKLGEFEGMEFDELGHLYCVNFISFTNPTDNPGAGRRNAFVLELPVGFVAPQISSAPEYATVSHATYYISSKSQSSFVLPSPALRSLMQLNVMFLSNNTTKVNVGATTPSGSDAIPNVVEENYPVILNSNFVFNINGTYSCGNLSIQNGNVSIESTNSNNRLIFTSTSDGCIIVSRTGEVGLTGDTPINVETPNNNAERIYFINVGYSYSETAVRVIPVHNDNKPLLIGARELASVGIYIGQTNTSMLNKGDSVSFTNGCVLWGYMNEQTLSFGVPVHKPIAGDTFDIAADGIQVMTPTGDKFTTTNGIATRTLHILDNSRFTTTVTKTGTNMLKVTVVSKNSEFAGENPVCCVAVYVNDTITITAK